MTVLCFSSRSHLRKLATIYASACCSSTSQTFYLPISLNSLNREGVRLLSPRDSQITSKNQLQVPMIPVAGDANQLKEELQEDLVHCVISFPVDQ